MPPKKPPFRSPAREKERSEPRRPSVSAKVGNILEYRVARLYQQMGFFVRNGRAIYTVGALDHATDLDVLAIRYAPPFRREVEVLECKSGREGPLDRVFWLSGLRGYVGASRASLVRQGTKWNIKDFAKQAGIEILDFPRLEELERSLKVDVGKWPGISDREFFVSRTGEWNSIFRTDGGLAELYLTLSGEVRFDEPFAGINFLLHHCRVLTKQIQTGEKRLNSIRKYLLAESVSQLSVFIMRVCEVCFGLADQDSDGLITKGLTYGHQDSGFTDRIFRNAHRITREVLLHHIGHEVQIDETLFRMPVPPNVREIQGIIRLLTRHPVEAARLIPSLDIMILEMYVKDGDLNVYANGLTRDSETIATLGLVRAFLRALHSIDAVPVRLVELVEGVIAAAKGGTSAKRVEDSSPTSDNPTTSRVHASDEQTTSKPLSLFEPGGKHEDPANRD